MKKEIDKTLYSVLFYSVDVLVGAQYVDTHNTRTCGAFCAHAKSLAAPETQSHARYIE